MRQDRDANSFKIRGGGILYYKEKSNIEKLDDLCFRSPDLEVLTCKLKLVNTRDIYNCVMYMPPTGDIHML